MHRNAHPPTRRPVRWQRFATPAFVMLVTATVPASAASTKPVTNAVVTAKAKTKIVPANLSIKFPYLPASMSYTR